MSPNSSRFQQLYAGQCRVLELLVTGESLAQVLDTLIEVIEREIPGLVCAVHIPEEEGRKLRLTSSPHLPRNLRTRLARIDASQFGFAPTAVTGIRNIVEDIGTDPYWRDLAAEAVESGIRSCWMEPIFESSHRISGVFVMYTPEPRRPTTADLQLLQTAAQVAGLALERRAADKVSRQLERAIEASGDAIVITDEHGRITRTNRAFCRLTGYRHEEVWGKDASILVGNDETGTAFAEMVATMRRREVWIGRVANPGKFGREAHMAITVSAVIDEKDAVNGYVAIGRDISGDMEREASLEDACRMAEAATRAKGTFLANMSHEIRTPMTAILGFAAYLKDPWLPRSDQEEAISTIERNGQHLLRILNDILDLSKIEAGGMTVERIACSPGRILSEALDLLAPRAAEKGITLEVKLTSPVPRTIETDPTRFRQILINLVGNAIKFTQSGGVTVVCGMKDTHSEQPRFEVAVIDTGIGIDDGKLDALYRPFTQAEVSTTREFGGTGLGLAISRRLVELLGGSLEVTSEIDKGSCFSFTVETGDLVPSEFLDRPTSGLFASPGIAPRGLSDSNTELGRLRVLVVDRPSARRQTICDLLGSAGSAVVVLDPDLDTEADDLAPYDAILIAERDTGFSLPAAARLLRSVGYRGHIIALGADSDPSTGVGLPDQIDRCLAAGCDGFIADIPDARELAALLLEERKPSPRVA